MLHPLRAYLDRTGEKVYSFARRANVPGTSLARALSGQRGLALFLAVRVEKATDGAVPMECWSRPRAKSKETRNGRHVTRRASV